jgi:chlorobactene glucosyltransferase
MFAIFSAWLYFLIYTIKSFKRLPKLESMNQQQHAVVRDESPKVSVILPARNEEKYIAKCLDSLLKQSKDSRNKYQWSFNHMLRHCRQKQSIT